MAYSAPRPCGCIPEARLSRMASVDSRRKEVQQQQEPVSHVGSRGSGLENPPPTQRLIHAEQLAFEKLAAFRTSSPRIAAVPEKHVPDVFVTRACEGRWARRQDVGQEVAETSLPALRAMFLAESVSESKKSAGLDSSFSCDTPIVNLRSGLDWAQPASMLGLSKDNSSK